MMSTRDHLKAHQVCGEHRITCPFRRWSTRSYQGTRSKTCPFHFKVMLYPCRRSSRALPQCQRGSETFRPKPAEKTYFLLKNLAGVFHPRSPLLLASAEPILTPFSTNGPPHAKSYRHHPPGRTKAYSNADTPGAAMTISLQATLPNHLYLSFPAICWG